MFWKNSPFSSAQNNTQVIEVLFYQLSIIVWCGAEKYFLLWSALDSLISGRPEMSLELIRLE